MHFQLVKSLQLRLLCGYELGSSHRVHIVQKTYL